MFDEFVRYASENRARVVWWGLTAAVVVLLGATVYSFVGTFVLGLFFYYAARPIHRQVREYVEGPNVSVLTTLLLFDLPFFAIDLYVIVVGLRELRGLSGVTGELLGRVLFGSPARFDRFLTDPTGYLTTVNEATLRSSLLTGAGLVGDAANVLVHLALATAVAFYLLRDGPRVADWARETLGGDPGPLWAYLRLVDRDLKVVYFGNIRTVLVVALLGVVVYNALDFLAPAPLSVPTPTLLALATGVATLIPLVVGKVVYLPVAGYLALEASRTDPGLLWFPAAFTLVAFAALDAFPVTVVRPYLAGRTTHGGLMMFAYIFGTLLFGWYGVFLGPFLLVCALNLVRVALGDLLHGEPITVEQTAPLAPGEADDEQYGGDDGRFVTGDDRLGDGDDGAATGAGDAPRGGSDADGA